MSIRLRLTLWYTGILSVVLLLFGIGLYFFLYYYIYDDVADVLKSEADAVHSRIQLRPSLTLQGNLSLDLALGDRDVLRNTGTYYQVVNMINGRKNKSANLEDLDIALPEINEERQQLLAKFPYSFLETAQIENVEFLIYNKGIYALQSNERKMIGVLQAALPMEQTARYFRSLRVILSFTVVLTIMLAASLGYFLARKALRPIDQVIEAAGQIEKGADLEKRILYDGPQDEIGRLTSTINGMLGRIQLAYDDLEEAYRAQRRFVSDASHELRTPLTTIRGNVDLLEKMWTATSQNAENASQEQLELSLEAMHDIAGEAARMSRLVSDLLSLARADAGFEMTKEPLELKPLVEEVARKAQLLPRTAEWITGDLSAIDGVFVNGNRDYLQQLLFIFVENAFKYTDTGFVRMDTLKEKDQVGIRIEDTGIGMDKEEVPHIFERFYRADVSRGQKSGTGLGLSIAKWIIDEHQGSIEVKTRKGEGSTFVIWLPVLNQNSTSDAILLS
ncbi:sensor histidine kinase [Paenibacillus hamazuiensis]|uniref:sensor histidine kinase n=1 Tax=Paenibacillus hamazuiensis TaxID=2936508 RepID=UPI00200BDFB5|nr:HAMP domain-containing sensor histidine kinase [Paenibacillus hamazuiensis]